MSNLKVRILHIAHCTLLIAHSGARFHSHTFMAPTHVQSLEVFPLHEPTCHLSLVTGDLRMLFPIVTLFSISSYQLPVTSYKSKRFLVPMRDHQTVEATQERFFEHGLSFTARECAAPAVAPRIWPANDRYSHRRAGAGPGPDWSE